MPLGMSLSCIYYASVHVLVMVMVMCVIITTAIVQLPKISEKVCMKEKKRETEMKREHA